MEVKAYQTETSYLFVCSQDDFEIRYEFEKQPPEGVETKQYLQDCKANSLGLAELELARLTPVDQEPEEPEELDI